MALENMHLAIEEESVVQCNSTGVSPHVMEQLPRVARPGSPSPSEEEMLPEMFADDDEVCISVGAESEVQSVENSISGFEISRCPGQSLQRPNVHFGRTLAPPLSRPCQM
jgi:hypothetical protein